MNSIEIRRAAFGENCIPEDPYDNDVTRIKGLLDIYAAEKRLLPRSEEDILAKIGNFRIAEYDGAFAGCAALRNYGNGLFEIRSLAVVPDMQGKGIGTALIRSITEELKGKHKPSELFSLTYRVELFQKLGFRIVSRALFPQKIWSDCKLCAHADHCDETALLIEIW